MMTPDAGSPAPTECSACIHAEVGSPEYKDLTNHADGCEYIKAVLAQRPKPTADTVREDRINRAASILDADDPRVRKIAHAIFDAIAKNVDDSPEGTGLAVYTLSKVLGAAGSTLATISGSNTRLAEGALMPDGMQGHVLNLAFAKAVQQIQPLTGKIHPGTLCASAALIAEVAAAAALADIKRLSEFKFNQP